VSGRGAVKPLNRAGAATASDDGGPVERNHRMELQYDGTGLRGWAKQDGFTTVEGCLEEAFRTVLGAAPTLRVAGRTDAGVHARRQVASLRLPPGVDLEKLRRSLNALTPPGIAVLALRPAAATFDARKDATSRTYRYFVSTEPVVSPFWNRYCWQVLSGGLDMGVMADAAALVAGRHDFSAFTPTETDHVFFDRTVLHCRWSRVRGTTSPAAPRPAAAAAQGATTVRGARQGAVRGAGQSEVRGAGAVSAWIAAGNLFCMEIEADAFLRHMVRTLVGTLVEVGRGECSLGDFERLLQGAPREAAGPTAPAQGLFLWDIGYGRRGGAKAARCGTIPGDAGAQVDCRLSDETADSEA
jgi:tRNA pseudouridine38-40 synthase